MALPVIERPAAAHRSLIKLLLPSDLSPIPACSHRPIGDGVETGKPSRLQFDAPRRRATGPANRCHANIIFAARIVPPPRRRLVLQTDRAMVVPRPASVDVRPEPPHAPAACFGWVRATSGTSAGVSWFRCSPSCHCGEHGRRRFSVGSSTLTPVEHSRARRANRQSSRHLFSRQLTGVADSSGAERTYRRTVKISASSPV